ncbi:hypothetical protein M948_20525 [Virgibacillus sp. CM-4]|uniref:Uncharacterized protein n=1 Tax=Virgibacillus massiliensis TaxID=1462526 RepID=A0A024QH70_9BACI|nr:MULTISPECIES: GIY-YIG nuclease family protein [Virgibacillus]EQB34774.1 hypothetical protein M948_20525 [Virgibacillus sp. CM-4]CDQ41525.1 hypothetical protein BN990_03898 [Virgibacillus massiliensis]
MIQHFGVNIRNKHDGLKLTRDNYIKVSNKSSLRKGKVYSDEYINKQRQNALYNYDLNIEYFNSLSKRKFNKGIKKFIKKAKVFEEIDNLSSFENVPGYYVMVLDDYAQAYIGSSKDIKKRIQQHWTKQKEFDRLIWGKKENSILSIDSFRAYDTTRIFVYVTEDHRSQENNFIDLFKDKYLLNRTAGGLEGLMESNIFAKTRDL